MNLSFSTSIDVTTLFKSCVKTIRTRNKAIGVTSAVSQAKIFPSVSVTTQFFTKARDIQTNIASHERLLYEHKKKYLNNGASSFTDIERAYMDKVISRNLKFIEENIRNLETEIKDDDGELSKNAKDCQQCVINILRSKYLRTSASFRDMKDHRQKKQREKEQLSRLQRPSSFKKHTANDDKSKVTLRQRRVSEKTGTENSNTSIYQKDEKLGTTKAKEVNVLPRNETNLEGTGAFDSPLPHISQASYLEDEMCGTLRDLDEEGRQLLEEENTHLYNELMSNQEEVKQITKQVVELSRMQDILTENVEIQAQEIDEIHETILHSTDNVQRGNEQVREAMRKDAGFRVWIMFFLIVMSLTILFLDWYSP